MMDIFMKKNKEQLIRDFDPNGIGIENGNFIGLPFDFDTSDIIIYPVPWDVTTSFSDGTSNSYYNILKASYQLDLFLEDIPNFWKRGIYFMPPNPELKKLNQTLRKKAKSHIESLESNKSPNIEVLKLINKECEKLNNFIQKTTLDIINKNKKLVLLGGDHSSPFGYIKALSTLHENFGILQIDAHCDLRKSYEGFEYSHASIFDNVLDKIPEVKQLTQIGIRDYCEEEAIRISKEERIKVFTNQKIRKELFNGTNWNKIVEEIIYTLPEYIYISFDIDGLNPNLCPNTGTPVPGGFSFNEILFLIYELRKSNKTIIGIDLCEVAGEGKWDGNVAARLLYRLMTLL